MECWLVLRLVCDAHRRLNRLIQQLSRDVVLDTQQQVSTYASSSVLSWLLHHTRSHFRINMLVLLVPGGLQPARDATAIHCTQHNAAPHCTLRAAAAGCRCMRRSIGTTCLAWLSTRKPSPIPASVDKAAMCIDASFEGWLPRRVVRRSRPANLDTPLAWSSSFARPSPLGNGNAGIAPLAAGDELVESSVTTADARCTPPWCDCRPLALAPALCTLFERLAAWLLASLSLARPK
eukprot:364570-Chlamydomonas_euryale.AAC.2